MDTHLAELKAGIVRIEGHCLRIDEHLDRLDEVSVKRLDAHADSIHSLERTRATQKGVAKVLATLAALGSAVGAWFKFG